MQAIKKNHKKIVALILVFTLCVSTALSFAYFTDRVSYTSSGNTSGNVKIETTAFAGASSAGILVDRDGNNNLNPGDVRDLTFTVTNVGNKAIDLRHTLKLTVTPAAGSDVILSDTAAQAEFDIYYAKDVTYAPETGYVLADGAKPVFSSVADNSDANVSSRVVDGNTITYYYVGTTLKGAEGVANSEREAAASTTEIDAITIGANGDEVTYEYILVYRGNTTNEFMNCNLQVDLIVEAKQHYNTQQVGDAENWEVVATQLVSTNQGDLTIDAVPDYIEDDADLDVSGKNGISAHTAPVGDAVKNELG